MSKDDRYIVPGLVRGLRVLEILGESGEGHSMSELAELMEVNRSSVFRIVHTLEESGYIRKTNDGKNYTLDAKVMDLGFNYLSSLDLISAARPFLTKLRDDVGIACHLVVLQDKDIIYVDQCQAHGSFVSKVQIGTRWPAYATVIGQMLLSDLPEEKVREIFKDYEDWASYTGKTPESLEALLERLESIRGSDSIISWGYFHASMATCAAPVFRRDTGRMAAVISVSCPIGRYTKEEFYGEVRAKVVEAASKLSRQLTHYNDNALG